MTDATCIIEGCEAGRCNGRGWCWKHYTRWRRGRPMVDRTLAECLHDGADRSAGPDACWPWTGTLHSHGYGMVRGLFAHRVSLELKVGRPLTSDEFACHHCDNPPCVNPDHLFVGSPADNMQDMVRKGRHPHRHYWINDDQVRWLYERRVSPDRIAELFGVSGSVIRTRVREMGLPPRRVGRPTCEQLEAADRAVEAFSRHGGAA